MEIKIFEIDCEELLLAEDLHEKLAEDLQLPPYYGKNLDALFDCLTEMHRTCIVLKNASLLEKDTYGQRLLDTFRDAAMDNKGLGLIEDVMLHDH